MLWAFEAAEKEIKTFFKFLKLIKVGNDVNVAQYDGYLFLPLEDIKRKIFLWSTEGSRKEYFAEGYKPNSSFLLLFLISVFPLHLKEIKKIPNSVKIFTI